jgi:hypothetical protein
LIAAGGDWTDGRRRSFALAPSASTADRRALIMVRSWRPKGIDVIESSNVDVRRRLDVKCCKKNNLEFLTNEHRRLTTIKHRCATADATTGDNEEAK